MVNERRFKDLLDKIQLFNAGERITHPSVYTRPILGTVGNMVQEFYALTNKIIVAL